MHHPQQQTGRWAAGTRAGANPHARCLLSPEVERSRTVVRINRIVDLQAVVEACLDVVFSFNQAQVVIHSIAVIDGVAVDTIPLPVRRVGSASHANIGIGSLYGDTLNTKLLVPVNTRDRLRDVYAIRTVIAQVETD